MGARLKEFAERWKTLKDPWCYKVIKEGLKLPFMKHPKVLDRRSPSSQENRRAIQEFLDKGALERTSRVDNALFFFVIQQGEKSRPILDCSPLNQYLRCSHFKMEDMKTATSLIERNDWLTKIDIKDAYLHIPLHPSASRHLGIRLADGTHWKCKAMPFGLNIAPLIFTRLMRAALKPLRKEGIRLVAYLDDLLIISNSMEQAVENTREVIRWLEFLGFILNYKKSMLCPSQEILFLGTLINTGEMTLSVPQEKIKKVQREARQILRKDNWSARKLAATIGIMNSVCKAMSPGMLMTRYLLANLTDALLKNKNNWDTTRVEIWDTSKEELRWWVEDMIKYNGRPFQQSATEMTIQTDASETGWGGVCGEFSCSGSWSDTDFSPSSNMRELLAIQKVIEAMKQKVKNKKLLIMSDNTTAIANVVKEGGNSNTEYIQRLKDLYWLFKSLNCTIVMRYIPGKNNVFADAASRRNFKDEYYLKQHAIDQIIQRWGRPSVDHVCDQREQNRSQVLLMESGSGSISNRCIQPVMERREATICASTNSVNTKSDSEIQGGTDQEDDTGATTLDITSNLANSDGAQERPDSPSEELHNGTAQSPTIHPVPTNDSGFATIPIDRDTYVREKARFTGLTETTLQLLGKGK